MSQDNGTMAEDVQAKIDAARRRAHDNFSSGYNCGECVVEAALGTIDTRLPSQSWKLATGLGGGLGLYGDTCGALIGAVVSVSAVHGREMLPEGADRQARIAGSQRQLYVDPGLYRIFNQVPNWFANRYGHTLCRELTARWKTKWLCREHALFCRELISEAVGFAVKLMLQSADEICSLPFGKTVERIKGPTLAD